MPAGVSFGTVERTAARFTLLVGDVVGLFRNLEFEREQFSRAHHAHPPEVDGIVYNCLNFFVTAQSLYGWFKVDVRERDGDVQGSEAAWQEALKAIRNADRQRTLYLDPEQRRALLKEIDPEAKPFVRPLCLLPLRPSAVAGLCVRDFDKRTSELSIAKDKSGKPRRVLVSVAAANLFDNQSKGKSGEAPLPARATGKAWDKETWKRPIAEAATKAKLPADATA